MRPIIKVMDVGKEYRLGERDAAYGTLRETIAGLVSAPLRRLRKSGGRRDAERIWALKDVSFEVKPGEIVGVIGRNGAGKSTLLKILSRITDPTTGRVDLYGRVGSLLEVGTGFHPELTGRENIFLNGSFLGMRRQEIERKFDEIVEFAGVEKFIDTPVKRYSSGMYVRLGFAVAAHLEPEILLVDEVLAVGDVGFQRKCLDKMKDVSSHGRTVVFISHNMKAITRLCPRTILLDEGRLVADGPSYQVASMYLKSGLGSTAAREWSETSRTPGNDIVRLCGVRVQTEDDEIVEAVDIRNAVGISMEYEVLKPNHRLVPSYVLHNDEGVCLFVATEGGRSWGGQLHPVGRFRATAWIPGNFLSEGSLVVGAAMASLDPYSVHFFERDVVGFQIIDSLDGDSARGNFAGHMPGVVRPLLNWTTTQVADPGAQRESAMLEETVS